MSTPYLSYYEKHSISPVTKNISNRERFFFQRYFLYQSLGIPASLKGHKVIEFGPGNGVNAIYTNSLQPEKYVLVDGNSVGVKNTRENLTKNYLDISNIEICESHFEKVKHEPKYDLVICENVLHGQNNPDKFLKMISDNVTNNGILMITCNDAVSVLSETLRTLIGLTLTQKINDFEEKTATLSNFFSKHLDALHFVGRDYRDWVQDNVLHEGILGASLFSIQDIIHTLSHKFVIYGSSPRFVQDMRWYKSVADRNTLYSTNEIAIDSYLKNMINMLDCRVSLPPHSVELGINLLRHAENIRKLSNKYIQSYDDTLGILIQDSLLEMSREIKPFSPITSSAIDAYHEIFASKDLSTMDSDASRITWWGRGTQYLSLINCPSF